MVFAGTFFFKIYFCFPPNTQLVEAVSENSSIDLNKTTSSLFWQVLVMLGLWLVCGRNLPLWFTTASLLMLTSLIVGRQYYGKP